MTELNPGRARVRRAPVAAAAAAAAVLALAGCSSTHVGESWQCPLAQGSECTSVAAADPAVPARAGSGTVRVLGEPLYRVRSEGDAGGAREPARAGTPCDSACGPVRLARAAVRNRWGWRRRPGGQRREERRGGTTRRPDLRRGLRPGPWPGPPCPLRPLTVGRPW